MKFLLDSVILIDHFNNIEKATQFISQHQSMLAISAITRIEVLVGFSIHSHYQLAKKLLDQFELYPITAHEADLAAKLRQEHKWKVPDAIQAAVAKHHKLKLVTRNIKDFNPKVHHFIFVPYEL